MNSTDLISGVVSFAAAFFAGAINSVAGGGTLLTFPTLIWLGLNSVVANATSTVALWPGLAGSTWAYRRELRGADRRLLLFVGPSLAGGLTGAVLLRRTPSASFSRLVPFLILFATLLFMLQGLVQRKLMRHAGHWSNSKYALALIFQFFVGVYGGYFGAGIGILMLAALSVLGLTDIHQMNGCKTIFSGIINGIAIVYFIMQGMVSWSSVWPLAMGSIVGGVAGAGIARRMGQKTVRMVVIAIGVGMAISLFIKSNSGAAR